MALSNWDTLSFDEQGNPSNGVLHGFKGGSVEIYKNWIYVRDPKMWHDKLGFTNNVIAQISEGDIDLSEFKIQAVRGPQNAIFVFASCTEYGDESKGTKTVDRWMAGIGCSGYDDNLPRLAKALDVDIKNYAEVDQMSSYGPEGNSLRLICRLKRGQCGPNGEKQVEFSIALEGNEHLESQWVGVTPETYKKFLSWLAPKVQYDYPQGIKDWYKKIKIQTPKRFNQGDAFFVGVEEAMTEMGTKEEPILMQALKSNEE